MYFALCWIIIFFFYKSALRMVCSVSLHCCLFLTNSLNIFIGEGWTLLVKAFLTRVKICISEKVKINGQKPLTCDMFDRWQEIFVIFSLNFFCAIFRYYYLIVLSWDTQKLGFLDHKFSALNWTIRIDHTIWPLN